MENRQMTEWNNLCLRLFLLATVFVLVGLLAYIRGMINILMAEVFVVLVVVLTLALCLVIRLDKATITQIMIQEPPKADEAAKKPDEILPPDKAREWLDDFLVEQQKDV